MNVTDFGARALGVSLALCMAVSIEPQAAESAGPTRVVATSFPLWLFARNLLVGLPAEVEACWPAGDGCRHDVTYTPAEQRRLMRAQYILVNGLEPTPALDAVLNQLPRGRARPTVIEGATRPAPLDPMDWIPERAPEGPAARAPAKNADGKKNAPRAPSRSPNPHYFASPAEAARTVRALAVAFTELPGMTDRRNMILLQGNLDRYTKELEELADEMRVEIGAFANRRIATQHDAFAYFARDLGLRVVDVLTDDPDHEPPPAALRAAFARIVRREAGAVFLEPGAAPDLAENVAQATGLPVDVLDPVANGPSTAELDHYQRVMRGNLQTLALHLRHAKVPVPDPALDPVPPAVPTPATDDLP